MINSPICYRCRETIKDVTQSIDCCQCYRYWHLDCLIQPVSENSLHCRNWKCPQHDGRSYVNIL